MASADVAVPAVVPQPQQQQVVVAAPGTSSSSTTTAAGGAGPTSALWLVGSRLREYASSTFDKRKPWGEVFDRTAFAKPASLQEGVSRLRRNAGYFRINYLMIVLATVAASFVTHPSSLFVLAFLLASWVYVFAVRQGPLVINGKELSEREKLLAMSGGSFVVVFFLTGVANVVFSALTVASAIVAAHGATRVPDDLFLDEGEAAGGGGLLSIITGGGGGGATTGANAV